MPLMLADAVAQIRELVQDTRGPAYRYSNARVAQVLTAAFLDARRLRADLFLPKVFSAVTIYTEADMVGTTEFPIDPMYFMAVVEYAVGVLEASDDEYAVDARAMTLLNRFTQKLVARGA